MRSPVHSGDDRPGRTQGDQRSSRQPSRPGFWQRCFYGWLRISGPDPSHFGNTLQEQERLRKSRLLSAMLLLIPVAVILFLPDVLTTPRIWVGLVTFFLVGLAAILLNSRGWVSAGALCYVVAIDAGVTVLMAVQPEGITNTNIPDFDLFVLAILIGGLILHRRFIPFLTLAHVGLMLLLFFTMRHDPLFLEEVRVHQGGLLYSALSDAFVIQVGGGLISWLGARSVDNALLRASRAEELAQARAHIDEQARQMAEQQQRLQRGIAVLKEVQAQVANGDYTVRATLQGNELFPLAVSLNLMVERLSRLGQIEQEHRRLEQALRMFFDARSRLASGGSLGPAFSTGTPLDRLIPVLERGYQAQHIMAQGVELVDELFSTQQDQQEHLSHLDSALTKIAASMPSYTKELESFSPGRNDASTGNIERPGSGQGRSANQSFSPMQDTRVLEDASQWCLLARQSGTHLLLRMRVLRQLLSVDQA